MTVTVSRLWHHPVKSMHGSLRTGDEVRVAVSQASGSAVANAVAMISDGLRQGA